MICPEIPVPVAAGAALCLVGLGLPAALFRSSHSKGQQRTPTSRILQKRFVRAVTLLDEYVLIGISCLVLTALIALEIEGVPAPLPLARLLLGLFFVLFAPGYAIQSALFPRCNQLEGPERVALSIGLSVAVIPPLALILDWLPWGIRLWPIVVGEGACIAMWTVVAVWQRARVPKNRRFVATGDLDLEVWWSAHDRATRALYGFVLLAVLLALSSAIASLTLLRPEAHFTEFYVLGSEGLAESYPREAAAGRPLTPTLGIKNRESTTVTYRIEVMNGEHLVGAAGPLTLAPGRKEEFPVIIAPVETGEDVKFRFLLYRTRDEDPYRTLRLWMKVKPLDAYETPSAGQRLDGQVDNLLSHGPGLRHWRRGKVRGKPRQEERSDRP